MTSAATAASDRLGAADTIAKVDAIAVRDEVRVRMGACYACSVRCKKVVHIEEREEAARAASENIYKGRAKVAFDPLGRYSVDPRYGGPEYESLAALGVNLGLEDLIAICKSNEMCNYLAMDTVSLGSTLYREALEEHEALEAQNETEGEFEALPEAI